MLESDGGQLVCDPKQADAYWNVVLEISKERHRMSEGGKETIGNCLEELRVALGLHPMDVPCRNW